MRGLRPTRRGWAVLAAAGFALGMLTGGLTYYDYEQCPTMTCDPWDADMESDHP